MADDATEGDKQGIQVISRAASILRALGRHPAGLSLGAIARETKLARSTVQRLVGALEVELFVESLGPSGGTRLGPAIGQLMHSAHRDFVTIVRPFLEVLSKEVDETVILGTATGRRAIVVDRVVAERDVCIMVAVGATSPPYTTAVGKALLAQLPDHVVRKLLSDEVHPVTEKSVRDVPSLLAELDAVRAAGVALEREEHVIGMCSVAVAIETYMGPYSVGISTPVSRFDENLQNLTDALSSSKREIELTIGRSVPAH